MGPTSKEKEKNNNKNKMKAKGRRRRPERFVLIFFSFFFSSLRFFSESRKTVGPNSSG